MRYDMAEWRIVRLSSNFYEMCGRSSYTIQVYRRGGIVILTKMRVLLQI